MEPAGVKMKEIVRVVATFEYYEDGSVRQVYPTVTDDPKEFVICPPSPSTVLKTSQNSSTSETAKVEKPEA